MKELIEQASNNYLLLTILVIAASAVSLYGFKFLRWLIKATIVDLDSWFFWKMKKHIVTVFEYQTEKEAIMKKLGIENYKKLLDELKDIRELLGEFTTQVLVFDPSHLNLKSKFSSMDVGQAIIDSEMCGYSTNSRGEAYPCRTDRTSMSHSNESFIYEHREFKVEVDYIKNEIFFNLKSMRAFRGFKRLRSQL